MHIIIKENLDSETLSIIDPRTGTDYISDFIGNTGALADGQFQKAKGVDGYLCDQKTFNWWCKIVNDNQLLVDRIHELTKEHGFDTVWEVVDSAGSVDLEDHAATVNQALDDAFDPKD